jgi:hypothetical protein
MNPWRRSDSAAPSAAAAELATTTNNMGDFLTLCHKALTYCVPRVVNVKPHARKIATRHRWASRGELPAGRAWAALHDGSELVGRLRSGPPVGCVRPARSATPELDARDACAGGDACCEQAPITRRDLRPGDGLSRPRESARDSAPRGLTHTCSRVRTRGDGR